MDFLRRFGYGVWLAGSGPDDERDETGQGRDECAGELYCSKWRIQRFAGFDDEDHDASPLQIIYATFLEYVINGKVPAARQIFGCALIMTASLYGRS